MQQYHSLDIIISIWLVLCSSIQPLIGVRINPRQRSVRHFPNFLERHLDPKEPSELGRSWAPVFISPRSPLLRLYAHSKPIKITWKLKKPFLGSIEKAPSGKHPIQRYMGWPYIKESRNWGLSQDSESSFREQPERSKTKMWVLEGKNFIPWWPSRTALHCFIFLAQFLDQVFQSFKSILTHVVVCPCEDSEPFPVFESSISIF